MQPTADRGVVPERTGAAMRRKHGFLQGVLGVLRDPGGQPRQPVQLSLMALEQFGEGVAVTCDMSGQQLGVTAFACPRPDSNHSAAAQHFTR